MITILVPNYYDYEAVNRIISDFDKLNDKSVEMLVLDADYKEVAHHKINTLNNDRIKVFYGLDKGVYDAFNFGIQETTTKYYIVVGVDDIFDFSKIDMILSVLRSTNYDLLFLGIEKSGVLSNFLKPDTILRGPQGVFPSHTGGVVINKELHSTYGLYSDKYKVLADGFFMSKCLLDKNTRFGLLADLYCIVGDQGFSKKKELLAEKEAFYIRNELGQGKISSLYIYLLRTSRRLIKNMIKKALFRRL